MNPAIRPSAAEARTLAADHDLIPVVLELGADLDTTVSVMLRLGTEAPCFFFESVEGADTVGRYSFLGHDPITTLTFRADQVTITRADGSSHSEACTDPLGRIEAEVGHRRVAPIAGLAIPFTGGAAGFLGYEAARYYERLPVAASDPLQLPDAWFGVFTTVIVFDHVVQRMLLVTHADAASPEGIDASHDAAVARLEALRLRLDAPGRGMRRRVVDRAAGIPPEEATANMSRERFLEVVERCREYIAAGDIYQVQVSRRFSVPFQAAPFDLYRALRAVNPSPYMFFLATPGCTLVGTSPEMLVRITDRRIEYHPIAGTRRRGRTPDDDARMEAELRASEKEAAEHLMLVDLGRNDVGRVSEIGSVAVTQFMEIERYSHVLHLVSNIEGTLRDDCSPLDALRACFPVGTVTGAPKLRAMEIIAELEPEARGAYAGAVGYIGFNGNVDTAIPIRTIVVTGATAHVQAAGGIVADSTASEEALEIDNKAAAALLAVRQANASVG